MASSPRPRWITVAAVALAGTVLMPVGTSDAKEFVPECVAAVSVVEGDRDVRLRIRCNFLVDTLGVTSSRALRSLSRRPRLDNPDRGDRLTCRRTGRRRRVECRGEVGEDVRIRGAYAVSGDPCDGLTTRFSAGSGIDCDVPPGVSCPDIGYGARVKVAHPGGC